MLMSTAFPEPSKEAMFFLYEARILFGFVKLIWKQNSENTTFFMKGAFQELRYSKCFHVLLGFRNHVSLHFYSLFDTCLTLIFRLLWIWICELQRATYSSFVEVQICLVSPDWVFLFHLLGGFIPIWKQWDWDEENEIIILRWSQAVNKCREGLFGLLSFFKLLMILNNVTNYFSFQVITTKELAETILLSRHFVKRSVVTFKVHSEMIIPWF